MLSDLEFEQQLKREFLGEAEEILQHFEDALLQFEIAADQGTKMNEMFRYAHSLKGSGLAAGFHLYGHFAHKLENLLDSIRAGNTRVSTATTNIMLLAIDALRSYGKKLAQDFQATMDFGELEGKLLTLTDKSTSASIPVSPRPIKPDASKTEPKFDKEFVPHIFICEDDRDTRELITSCMPTHWLMESFESGEDFISKFDQVKPHLIITDLKLPGMSGREVIEYVRASSPKTPVIFISGYAKREDIVKFLQLGAFAFYEKPFNVNELRQTAQRALRDWFYQQTVEEITLLAFRTFMSFGAITDIMKIDALDPIESQKVRIFEEDLTKIGALCTRASKFAKY